MHILAPAATSEVTSSMSKSNTCHFQFLFIKSTENCEREHCWRDENSPRFSMPAKFFSRNIFSLSSVHVVWYFCLYKKKNNDEDSHIKRPSLVRSQSRVNFLADLFKEYFYANKSWRDEIFTDKIQWRVIKWKSSQEIVKQSECNQLKACLDWI